MANETTLTLVGNLTRDPELNFGTNGDARANFTVAVTPRSFDKGSGQWVDGEPMFLDCTAWRQMAENLAESLTRGTRVVVTGRLKQRHWETPEGEKRSRFGLDVDEVGPSLRFATADVRKAQRGGGAGGDQWSRGGASASDSGEAPF